MRTIRGICAEYNGPTRLWSHGSGTGRTKTATQSHGGVIGHSTASKREGLILAISAPMWEYDVAQICRALGATWHRTRYVLSHSH